MQRSIATPLDDDAHGVLPTRRQPAGSGTSLERVDVAYLGLFFATVALGIYIFSDPSRNGLYNHFVWQADAFLQGRFGIAYPVADGPFVNAYFQDVMPLPAVPGSPSLTGCCHFRRCPRLCCCLSWPSSASPPTPS